VFGGELLRFVSLADSVDHKLTTEVRLDATVRSAVVERVDADSAVVALVATVAGHTHFVSGVRRSWTSNATGPVQLVREGDSWKVADLVVDDRSVLGSFRDLALDDGVGALHVRAVAGRFVGSSVRLYLELDNRSGRAVPLRHPALGTRRRTRWSWRRGLLGAERVQPGLSRVEASGSAKRMDGAVDFRYVFDTDEGCVDLRPAGVTRLTRTPLAARAPIAYWLLQVAAIAAAAGLLVRLLFGIDPFFIVGFELVFFGCSKLVGLLRQARGRPGRAFVPWLAVATVVVLVGLGVVILDFGSLAVFGRARSCLLYLFVNWWGLGLLLLYVAAFQAVARRPRRARRLRRPQLAAFAAAVAVAALGALLVVRHGGFALLTPSGLERHNVRNYLRSVLPQPEIRSLHKVMSVPGGRCTVDAWDATTNFGRFWVLTNPYGLFPRAFALRRAIALHDRGEAARCRR
jgi:hypothetical protein